MIEFARGNLLEAQAEALVNTVNSVGVMGKGIALQFKQAFPKNYDEYRKAAKAGRVRPGRMFVFPTGKVTYPHYIINFPTKRHWKGKARLEDIESGLRALVEEIRRLKISSIAVPPLGCGNGGLAWRDVRPLMESALGQLSEVRVTIFEPAGAPAAADMPVATSRPNMTAGRAAVIALLHAYLQPGYRATMLEIEKLTYFLQIAGEPLKLQFAKGKYGPYAENLQFVLQRIEGHFIRGYGDRSRDASVRLLPGAFEEASAVLAASPPTLERLERVTHLIDGLETPYGLELLATVLWLSREDPRAASNVDDAIHGVQHWSPRKKQRFSEDHIRLAWERLHAGGWLPDPSEQVAS